MLQLREKQKIKRIYGVSEKQFHNTFERVASQPGITGHNLLAALESRLDNVVYRMGFAASRKAARQLIRHRHVEVNGKSVDIPSYVVAPGEDADPVGRDEAAAGGTVDAARGRVEVVARIDAERLGAEARGKFPEKVTAFREGGRPELAEGEEEEARIIEGANDNLLARANAPAITSRSIRWSRRSPASTSSTRNLRGSGRSSKTAACF